MGYDIVRKQVSGFPPGVERVYIEGRWVGFVYFDREAVAELPGIWMAHYAGTQPVGSREEGIQRIVEYAKANPSHAVR